MKNKKFSWKQKATLALVAAMAATSIPSNVMAGQMLSSTEAAGTSTAAREADFELPEAWAVFDFNQEAQNGKFTSTGSEAIFRYTWRQQHFPDWKGKLGKWGIL